MVYILNCFKFQDMLYLASLAKGIPNTQILFWENRSRGPFHRSFSYRGQCVWYCLPVLCLRIVFRTCGGAASPSPKHWTIERNFHLGTDRTVTKVDSVYPNKPKLIKEICPTLSNVNGHFEGLVLNNSIYHNARSMEKHTFHTPSNEENM